MGFGLRIKNPSGELTVSSEGRMPYCIGKCTLKEISQPAGYTGDVDPGKVGGFSRYEIQSNSIVTFAVAIPVGWYVGILNAYESSPGTWTVYVSSGNSLDSDGYLIQQPVDVFAYAVVPFNSSSYGLRFRNASGQITVDLANPNPLFPRALVDALKVDDFYNIPSFGNRTLLLGNPNETRFIMTDNPKEGINYHDVKETMGTWYRPSENQLQVKLLTVKMFLGYGFEDGGNDFSGKNLAFVLDGSRLP